MVAPPTHLVLAPLLNETVRPPVKIDTGTATGIDRIRKILASVADPEIPVLSIVDLGILRTVDEREGGYIITITPTYTGCPAMQSIAEDIHAVLAVNAIENYTLITQLTPAWSTDRLTRQGREKLLAFGIAPPVGKASDKRRLCKPAAPVPCPQCRSTDTVMLSEFGSTACKALYQCHACLEPFDHFKCL